MYYTLRFMSYTGHASHDVIFYSEKKADAEYARTLAVRDAWIKESDTRTKKEGDLFPWVAFDTRGDDGIPMSLNLLNFTVSRLDPVSIAKSRRIIEDLNEEADARYGKTAAGIVGTKEKT